LVLAACGGSEQVHAPKGGRTLELGASTENAILLSAPDRPAQQPRSTRQAPATSRKPGALTEKADATSYLDPFLGDFDGDGKEDILWRTNHGAASLSLMNGSAVASCATLETQTDNIVGTGDFDGNGRTDVVWRNMSTGAVRISLMNAGAVVSWLNVGQTPIALNVRLEAVGDFDGNGRADMLWRNQSTGRSVMSYHDTDGSVSEWLVVSNYIALNTSALKVGDINGDGKDDIVWRNMGTGNVVLSLMNGHVPTWRGLTATPIALSVALEAVGDFDNNGRADLLWRNTRTGNSLMSYHNLDGSVASWPVVSNYINPTTTKALGVGDFDGDGKDDILWRNQSSGNTVVSLMNGNVPSWVGVSFSTCPEVSGYAIDTSDRDSVLAFYRSVYETTSGVASGWNGNLATCQAGTVSSDYLAAFRRRINWFRAMAGVPANIVLDSELNRKAQQAALMMSANRSLSHYPPTTWACYTADGSEAAGSSNIALGFSGPDTVSRGYIQDAGQNNYAVGHRRWLLYPQTRTMGVGDVTPVNTWSANAIWVIDSNYWSARPAVRDGFVAWPPKGYVPFQTVYPRWSLSYPEADFTNAVVTMTRNGSAVAVSLEPLLGFGGVGEDTLVWIPATYAAGQPWSVRPAADTTYQVTVTNVLIAGQMRSFSYSVTVFAP
jgi:uncharacterized protein YkwD